jgi:NADH-quinone oxidoreductase subunit J
VSAALQVSAVVHAATTAATTGGTHDTSVGEAVLFWILAPIMVLAALGLLWVRKAVHVALCVALVMVGLGITYLAQEAPFLGAVQIFVYTGAVMMLFLFVIMLIGVQSTDSLVETIRGQRAAATVLGVGFAILLLAVFARTTFPKATGLGDVNRSPGNITGLAGLIFGDYVWAFEVTSALLITAALGAMILAHRERLLPKVTQAELSRRRISHGPIKAPLPAPGVFARHNAVDTPALLPDGTPSELSVSRVLTARGQTRSVAHVTDDVATLVSELNAPLGELTYPDGLGPDGQDRLDAEDAPAADTAEAGARAVATTTGDTVLERERP